MAQSFWPALFTRSCFHGTALPKLISGWISETVILMMPLPPDCMKPPRKKSCSSCGESFTCGPERAEEKCWCEQLPHVSFVANQDQDCLCPTCLCEAIKELNCRGHAAAKSVHPATQIAVNPPQSLVEGDDYYSEGGMIIFTERYHLRRGYCCENGCRHCPYTGGVRNDKKSPR
jgi:uncharacterized protein DUF5522/cysteine-rich CWC protein